MSRGLVYSLSDALKTGVVKESGISLDTNGIDDPRLFLVVFRIVLMPLRLSVLFVSMVRRLLFKLRVLLPGSSGY